jgi:hypothetical protein
MMFSKPKSFWKEGHTPAPVASGVRESTISNLRGIGEFVGAVAVLVPPPAEPAPAPLR